MLSSCVAVPVQVRRKSWTVAAVPVGPVGGVEAEVGLTTGVSKIAMEVPRGVGVIVGRD
jgi:hypothetical protein